MKAHVLQHAPFEDIGSMAGWLSRNRAQTRYTRFFQQDAALPEASEVDLLIIMGGPMSVNDEEALPWLRAEKQFIAEVIRLGRPVLGICLGAQLIATALGARVHPGAHREIGWFDVAGVPAPADCFSFPARLPVFHWHGETFELPAGAQLLARSAACAHQAFQCGERVIGLQCHPEVTEPDVRGMLEGCSDELDGSPWVQSAEEMCAAPASHYRNCHALLERLLDYLTR